MLYNHRIDTAALIDLGEVATLTKGTAIGVLDVGAGEKLPFEGLSDD